MIITDSARPFYAFPVVEQYWQLLLDDILEEPFPWYDNQNSRFYQLSPGGTSLQWRSLIKVVQHLDAANQVSLVQIWELKTKKSIVSTPREPATTSSTQFWKHNKPVGLFQRDPA